MNDTACFFDTNVWIALTFDSHPGHSLATAAFGLASDEHPVCICRAVQQSFLRLATTKSLLRAYGAEGLNNDDVIAIVEGWLASSKVRYCEEPPRLFVTWKSLVGRPTAEPKLWMDTFLAAFAIESDFEMISLDRDMSRFERAGLRLSLLVP